MALLSFANISATGLGPVAAGWIEANSHFEWRWIQRFNAITAALSILLIYVFMPETRMPVLLTRRAKQIRKETGDARYCSRAELELPSLRTLLYISCTRPLVLLLTEPVVASFSAWIGFAWGILYGLVESVAPAFRSIHGFGTGEVGTVFLALVFGALFGILSNFHQDSLYRKHFPRRGPEARLCWAMAAGVMFPAAEFIYAWTSFPSVPWIAMVIGITLFMWATFVIYLAGFSYLADCYGPYASSAIAGQSLCRNVVGASFPLFTTQMYNALSYKWGNTIFGGIATLMIPIPFVLFRYGPAIRMKSTFSRQAMGIQ